MVLGGTVTLAGGGDFAAISDPERDLIHVIDLKARTLRGIIRLPQGSQPTRGVEDGRGFVRVVLRGTGQVATVSVGTASSLRTDSVCPEPRDITWDTNRKAAIVACASGELVTMPVGGSVTVRRYDADLRDVVLVGNQLKATTFRSAKLLDVAEAPSRTEVAPPTLPLPMVRNQSTAFVPQVAYRALATSDGRVIMVHQRAVDGDIDAIRTGLPPTTVPYYRNPCGSAVVRSAVTVFRDQTVIGSIEVPGVLPVDAALSPDGTELVIVNAGNAQLVRIPLAAVSSASTGVCGPVSDPAPTRDSAGTPHSPLGQPVGVAITPVGETIVHSRDPNQVVVMEPGKPNVVIPLTDDRIDSAGVRLFFDAVGGISCASCHPEGHEDGHVWTFFGKERRTQPLSGGISQTAPFHWEGDLSTMDTLMADTFVSRMGGIKPSPAEVESLTAFLDAVRAPRAPTRDTPVDMTLGRAAFVKAACDSCHGGPLMTSPLNVDVGTGRPFQVPPLKGVASRGPWMHDGCAKTLSQRFTDVACGGDKHGHIDTLAPSELEALIAYLSQL
jgi:DNA-binding beta-propeller fold protein YncE